jgi:hypothetical protein
VVGRFCEHKEDVQCGEAFSHAPNHIMRNNTHTGVGTIENCVYTEIFIQYPSLSLSVRTQSAPEPCEYQEYGENPFKW